MRTKARQTFETKINYFLDDIDLVDVLRTSVLENDLTDPKSPKILSRVDPNQHPHLNRRKNSDGSRELIVNHLRSTIYSGFVKDIYEEITHYLRRIMEDAAKSGFNSDRIIGEHSFTVDVRSVLRIGNWEQLCKYVTDSVFQALERERSTMQLLKKMSIKLGLNVPSNLIEDILPYLEVRHFLVHTDGQVTAEFRQKYQDFSYMDNKIRLNYAFVTNTHTKSLALIEAFDEALIANNLLSEEYLQP
ncbi:MAG: hypothetical protein OXC10_06955 [Rhodospirillaceae bacterium]|nr:hypothetical protein [Rhodospirillaceae bacterium]